MLVGFLLAGILSVVVLLEGGNLSFPHEIFVIEFDHVDVGGQLWLEKTLLESSLG